MKIFLVCGYKRTGKDFLYDSIMKKDVRDYIVLSRGDKLYINNDIRKHKISTPLLKEVNTRYKIDLDDYEKYKDKIIYGDTTYRKLLTDHASVRREEDPNYWIDLSYKSLIERSIKSVMITDWRYPNELAYLKTRGHSIKTIRVFCDSVPVPDTNIESEHSLDNFVTDFVIFNKRDQVETLLKNFPQYRNFTNLSPVSIC